MRGRQDDKETAELLAQILSTIASDGNGLSEQEQEVQSKERSPGGPEGPGPCPRCGAETRRKVGRNGAFYGCINYPDCRGTRNAGQELIGPGPCPFCGSPTEPKVGARGPFYGCVRYPECKGSRNFDLDTVLELPSPKKKPVKPPRTNKTDSPPSITTELTATVPPLPPELVDDDALEKYDPLDDTDDWLFDEDD